MERWVQRIRFFSLSLHYCAVYQAHQKIGIPPLASTEQFIFHLAVVYAVHITYY
jgi:hypothetical protein